MVHHRFHVSRSRWKSRWRSPRRSSPRRTRHCLLRHRTSRGRPGKATVGSNSHRRTSAVFDAYGLDPVVTAVIAMVCSGLLGAADDHIGAAAVRTGSGFITPTSRYFLKLLLGYIHVLRFCEREQLLRGLAGSDFLLHLGRQIFEVHHFQPPYRSDTLNIRIFPRHSLYSTLILSGIRSPMRKAYLRHDNAWRHHRVAQYRFATRLPDNTYSARICA